MTGKTGERFIAQHDTLIIHLGGCIALFIPVLQMEVLVVKRLLQAFDLHKNRLPFINEKKKLESKRESEELGAVSLLKI